MDGGPPKRFSDVQVLEDVFLHMELYGKCLFRWHEHRTVVLRVDPGETDSRSRVEVDLRDLKQIILMLLDVLGDPSCQELIDLCTVIGVDQVIGEEIATIHHQEIELSTRDTGRGDHRLALFIQHHITDTVFVDRVTILIHDLIADIGCDDVVHVRVEDTSSNRILPILGLRVEKWDVDRVGLVDRVCQE